MSPESDADLAAKPATHVRDAAEYLVRFIAPNMATPEPALQWGAMLDAFAQRREQEEALVAAMSGHFEESKAAFGANVYSRFAAENARATDAKANAALLKAGHKSLVAEALREEGRREVLRQIDDPVVLRRESEISGKHFECLFCHASNSTHRPDYKEVDHENDCLWRRAQEVTQE